MRVSDRQRYDLANAQVELAKNNNVDLLEQLSTQKRINRVSDDPVGIAQSLKRRSQIAGADQFIKNAEFSRGYLERAESSLVGIHDFLIRAKELGVALSNGTYDASSRESTSLEIKQIIDEVISLANASYSNRYVFGGFRSQNPPVGLEGAFLGDDGAIFLQVDDGTFRQINLQARNLFEPNVDEREKGHFGLVATLSMMKESLSQNDIQGIRKSLDELDFQMDKTTRFQAELGSIHNALGSTIDKLALAKESTAIDLSRIEDADVYKVTSDFKRTESVLQSTLMASNKLLQPSLMNFMQ